MYKLLKETLKSGRKKKTLNSEKALNLKTAGKDEASDLFPSKLPNQLHLCVYLYYGEGTEETKAMPQWLRAGHCLLQASGPFLTSSFKTPLITLNLRQSKLLCWLKMATAVSPHTSLHGHHPLPCPASPIRKREKPVTTGFPCQQFLQHRRLGSHFSSIFWPREKRNLVQKQSKWEHVSQRVMTEKQSVWPVQDRNSINVPRPGPQNKLVIATSFFVVVLGLFGFWKSKVKKKVWQISLKEFMSLHFNTICKVLLQKWKHNFVFIIVKTQVKVTALYVRWLSNCLIPTLHTC